jgi:lysophospholipase L1-like esterase
MAKGHRLAAWGAAALLMLCGIALAGLVAEAALRAAHFRYQPFPEVQFGWPEPQVILNDFVPDADLHWVPRDYAARLNAARDSIPAIIFLGDSCVEFSTYPRLTVERLATLDPSLSSGTKLSVPGWSSEQGRSQLERDVLPLRPQVVVIEFGWNDHWDALGPADDELHPSRLEVFAAAHCRLVQAYLKARDGLLARSHVEPPRRVALARYRENLEVMARDALRAGAHVVLVTAPTDHEAGHEPSYLQARHLRHLSTLVPLHRSYVQATREAAATTGATLCDAAAAIEASGPQRRSYFRRDGIHFSAQGDRFMAALVADCLVRSSAPRSAAH